MHEHWLCPHHCMNVVHSSDHRAHLSCIEILWYLGKKCMIVGTEHHIKQIFLQIESNPQIESLSRTGSQWIFIDLWRRLLNTQIYSLQIFDSKLLLIVGDSYCCKKRGVTSLPILSVPSRAYGLQWKITCCGFFRTIVGETVQLLASQLVARYSSTYQLASQSQLTPYSQLASQLVVLVASPRPLH